jgi:hypothetical protein
MGSVKQVMLPKQSDKKQRLFTGFVKIVQKHEMS